MFSEQMVIKNKQTGEAFEVYETKMDGNQAKFLISKDGNFEVVDSADYAPLTEDEMVEIFEKELEDFGESLEAWAEELEDEDNE